MYAVRPPAQKVRSIRITDLAVDNDFSKRRGAGEAGAKAAGDFGQGFLGKAQETVSKAGELIEQLRGMLDFSIRVSPQVMLAHQLRAALRASAHTTTEGPVPVAAPDGRWDNLRCGND